MSLSGSKHLKQYIIAEAVTAGGAFKLPYTSNPVPWKSKIAVPWSRSMVIDKAIGVPRLIIKIIMYLYK